MPVISWNHQSEPEGLHASRVNKSSLRRGEQGGDMSTAEKPIIIGSDRILIGWCAKPKRKS